MAKKIHFYLLLVFICFFSNSCYKDTDFENEITSEIKPPEVLSEVNGSILGYVYDTDNNPIADASVNIYSASTTTNEFGVFQFDNVKLDEHGTYLTVRHPDYVMGSDFIYAKTGVAQSRVQMIKLRNDVTFNSSEGAVVNAEKGGTITFPPNAIQDEQGNLYNGVVQVTAHLISVNDDKISELMPGSLLAQDARGRTVSLGTAGMMAIELRSSTGQELNIADGELATIKLPVSQNGMPDEIPTWSFNESSGRWQEEGIAIFDNGFYVFDVPHLSFWNCDYPFPLVSVSGRVLNTNGEPVSTSVGVRSELYGVEYAQTDTDGFFSGKVPSGEILEFFVYGFYCSENTFRTTLGPFNVTTQLSDFVVDRTKLPHVLGEVQCATVPYSNATIIIEAEEQRYVYNVIENGEFDFNPNLICDNITTGLIWAYDNATNKASPQYPIDFENPGTFILDVCEIVCDFSLDVTYNCGDSQIDVAIINPDGTYSYNWDSGEATSVINVSTLSSDVYCLTVTEDISGCEQTICQETSNLSLSLWWDVCSASIYLSFQAGSAPFEVDVDDGSSFTSNSGFAVHPYSIGGNYCFDVTDKVGCTTQECIFVDDPFLSTSYIDYNPSNCDLNKYYYNAVVGDLAIVDGPQGVDALQVDGNGYFINVAVVGYKDIRVEFQNGCGYTFDITTPFFEGLQDIPTVSNATCITCADGQITYVVDVAADCIDCDYGEVRIFDADFNDVTVNNDNSMLPVGIYYVAALDQTSGCFIASHSVEVMSN